MSKTNLKTKIMEKVVGNPSNTVSIFTPLKISIRTADETSTKLPVTHLNGAPLMGAVSNLHWYKKEEPPIDDNVITEPKQTNMDIKYEYVEKEPLEHESYVYIDNDDLSRDIGLHRDVNLEYNLSICIYKINHELRTPFLEFFFEKKEGFYQFPETTITFNNIPENTDIDTYFLDECSRLYNSKSEKSNENISEMYKGFVDVGNNNIIAIFENPDFIQSAIIESQDVLEKPPVSNAENPQEDVLEKPPLSNAENPQEDSIWAILDEITIKKRILDIPIKQYIIDMFNEYKVLNNIKDSTNFPIEKPIILYQCNGTYKNYENNYYNENEHRSKSISMMDERIDHDVFGNIYLFSIQPLEYDNLSKIKRYAAFVNNTLYMLNDTNITKEELVGDEQDISKLPFKTYHCISFKEDEKDYWSINTNHLFIEL